MLQPREQTNMSRGEVWSTSVHGVVDLSSQVFVMLAGQSWGETSGIAGAAGTVTLRTVTLIALRPELDEVALSHAGRAPDF